jgi:hypothetical protein
MPDSAKNEIPNNKRASTIKEIYDADNINFLKENNKVILTPKTNSQSIPSTPKLDTNNSNESTSSKENESINETSATNGIKILNSVSLNSEKIRVKNTKNLITNPSTMVQKFQIALFNKITNYGGGISGIWNAIDPNLKGDIVLEVTKTGKTISEPRIKWDAFYKAIKRLENETLINEHMSFGIHGNIILMMNIFEILGIKGVDDLLENSFTKPDILSLIMESNSESKRTLREIIALRDDFSLLKKNKSRISIFKVCNDWEQVLNITSSIVNSITPFQYSNKPNISWDYYSIVNNYIEQYDNKTKIACYTYMLLRQFRVYSPQEPILSYFIKRLKHLSFNNMDKKETSIIIAPLFLLYFFFLFQKRFIKIYIDHKIQLFKPAKMDVIDNENNSDEENFTEIIWEINSDMLKKVKKILELFKSNIIDITALENLEFMHLVSGIIMLFKAIYTEQVNYNETVFWDFIKGIKSLDDLNKRLSFCKPLIFLISDDQISVINNFNNQLEVILRSLLRSRNDQ